MLEVQRAAQQVASGLQREVRFRFDPDHPDPAQTQLLATLAATRAADAAVDAQRDPLQTFTKKSAALQALARLEELLADPRTAGLRQTVESYERVVDPGAYSPEQLWQEYSDNAASVNAVLSTAGGTEPQDEEAAQGYIPGELRQEISAVPLDTSQLTATLRGYQVFGAQYAIHQQRAMLGDEMGLGTTLETLAACAHLAANGQRQFLVVCPASVGDQLAARDREAHHAGDAQPARFRSPRPRPGAGCARAGWRSRRSPTLGRLPPEAFAAGVAMLVGRRGA